MQIRFCFYNRVGVFMVNIDVNENELYKKYPRVLDLLLFDNTTRKNIIWATLKEEIF